MVLRHHCGHDQHSSTSLFVIPSVADVATDNRQEWQQWWHSSPSPMHPMFTDHQGLIILMSVDTTKGVSSYSLNPLATPNAALN